MKKSSTSSFVAERRILIDNRAQKAFLEKRFFICERLYNNAVRHYRKRLSELYKDIWFNESLKQWKAAKTAGDDAAAKEWAKEVSVCAENYGITEYGIHAFLGEGKRSAYEGGIGINIAQKVGTVVYRSISKLLFRKRLPKFKKYGTISSFEDKSARVGIIYNPKEGTVAIVGRQFRLKPVRKHDLWMQEAVSCSRVKYCRVVRKPFRSGYRYFLQIVFEGYAPEKLFRGNGTCGLDQGTSTAAYTNDDEVSFNVLVDGVEKYDAAIKRWSKTYHRRQIQANPECFLPDGRIKKGCRLKNRTSGMLKALFRLKDAYRRKAVFVKQSHCVLANRIISSCDTIVKEPMDFKSLQKRASGPAERQEKASCVTKPDGTRAQVHKYKKKRRFGTSIGKRNPGLFNSILERKAIRYGVEVINVNIKKYRASQYDHTDGSYTKHSLSNRTKRIGGHLVQRDLYSSFLLKHMQDLEKPDRNACASDFKRFLKCQGTAVAKVIHKKDTTGNFGLRDFLAA